MARHRQGPDLCRGYLSSWAAATCRPVAYVPEVVLEHPERRAAASRVRPAGLRHRGCVHLLPHRRTEVIGARNDLKPMNLHALAIARKVAAATPALFWLGNICNTTTMTAEGSLDDQDVRAMFEETCRMGGRCRRRTSSSARSFGYTQRPCSTRL